MYACRPEEAPDLITDGCELPCGCWELDSEPLEEQPVLLTTEPSLQPPKQYSLINCIPAILGLRRLRQED